MRHTMMILAAAAATATAQDTLYVGGPQGVLLKADPNVGAFSFGGSCGGPINSLAYDGRHVLAGDSTGAVYLIDTSVGFPTGTFSLRNASHPTFDNTAMAIEGNMLLATASDGAIRLVDAATHTIDDTYYVNFDIQAAVVAQGMFYVAGPSTLISRADVGQSAYQFFSACGGAVYSAATDGTDLFFGADNGTVYRFDASTGQYQVTFATGTDCNALAFHDGDLLVADSSGEIVRMNPDTGATISTMNVGSPVNAMLIVTGCTGDFDRSGDVNTNDFFAFLADYQDQDHSADISGDGLINTNDFFQFLNAYQVGC